MRQKAFDSTHLIKLCEWNLLKHTKSTPYNGRKTGADASESGKTLWMELQIGGGDSRYAMNHDCWFEAIGDACKEPQVVHMQSWVCRRAGKMKESYSCVYALPRYQPINSIDVFFIESRQYLVKKSWDGVLSLNPSKIVLGFMAPRPDTRARWCRPSRTVGATVTSTKAFT
ncbi:hypothetical protein E2C01_005356 [Portunus trituberculatus]|uniref:Uncharacterized protein n=1 Tax=Portunus trituberculatus TaxID=210409 RepID=A0A5B7CYZ2_PORTR|nr:hypothetical protein [Portunus trituberculatus]